MAANTSASANTQTDQQTPWFIIGGLGIVILWAYWNTIEGLLNAWTSAQYSHGFLIPIFAAVLIAMRREPFEPVPSSVRWWGVAIMAGGLLFRLFSSYHNLISFDMVSIIPVLAGVFVIAGGWPALRWSAAPLAFLIFMLPLPTAAERGLLNPLQHAATTMSTYTLQTMGVDAFNEGNKILIGEGFPLNVEEQCSGLRMATIFLALAVAMSMIIDRPWWQKAFIIASAIPIALLVNVIRIVITALLFMVLGQESEFAKEFFHNLAGWFMIPIALGFMYLEMQILDRVFIEETHIQPQSGGLGSKSTTVRRPMPTRVR
ncbi:MAG TPA: exosortase/archaeosortase family protein [Pirellulales bacterium]|nr:exosortase/archaeosortase family protein [Pirellulales bacterium]